MKKYAPKGIKICPGCLSSKLDPIVTPKFKINFPSKDSKVTVLKEPKKDSKIHKRGESTSLF